MSDDTKKPTIKPLDGWTIQTPYGTLKTRSGVHLVRLEDVHTWMCGNGESPNNAVYKIFSPFYKACLSAAVDGDKDSLSLTQSIFVMNALTPPDSLVIGTNQSKVQAVKFFASAFPELGHIRLEDGSIGGLVYAIGEGALRVWRGTVDIHSDHLAVLKDRHDREQDEKYAISWPKDEDLKKLLGRLAAPIELAYELWGWGSVTEVVQLHSVPLASANTQTELQTVGKWTDERLAQLLEDFRKTTGKTVAARRQIVADKWKCSPANVKKYLAKAEKNTKSAAMYSQLVKHSSSQ
ncbi:hypothetical protein [Rhodoferax sp. BLA1]|uniref:hypothetical protein n=1 Tax=Rhodoferax sp. BLA1 TaxID=2576062 RepID=UPI0015D19136|nr:hypothetical protein [Rhodoferax sp. BLA1]